MFFIMLVNTSKLVHFFKVIWWTIIQLCKGSHQLTYEELNVWNVLPSVFPDTRRTIKNAIMTNIFFCFSEVGRYVLSGGRKFRQSRSILLLTHWLWRGEFSLKLTTSSHLPTLLLTRFVHPSLLSFCPKQCQTIPAFFKKQTYLPLVCVSAFLEISIK